MRDPIRGEDHAVAAAWLDRRRLMLGNMRMAMIEDGHVRNYPLFVMDQSGVMKYSELPPLAGAPELDLAPSTALNLVTSINERGQRSAGLCTKPHAAR
jgi:hypothetical protein